MKLNALRDFLAVAERGSLRAAARQLDVAQPAITRSIQELEKELGVSLFERCAKGVLLTPMGELFLRRSKAVRSELRRAQDEIDQLRGKLHGQIRVCLSSAAHIALMPSAMGPFRQAFPDVKVDLIDALFPAVENDVRDGTLDCYVGPVFDSTVSDLSVEKLFDNTRVILGRTGHPLSQARSLSELVDAEWITTAVTHIAEDELTPLFERQGLPPPRIVVSAHSALSYLFLVAHSDLLTLLPIQWTTSPMFRNALHPIRGIDPVAAPPICIVQRRGLPLTPAAEYFCDMLRRAAVHMGSPLTQPPDLPVAPVRSAPDLNSVSRRTDPHLSRVNASLGSLRRGQ